MSESDNWTVGRLLTWTTDYLKQHDSDSPRLDAEVLLADARGCQRIDLYAAFDEVADERVRTEFREYVRRRALGEPVAYLVGYREFYSLSFRVTPDVLIPRPETEHLVVEVLDRLKEQGSPETSARVADVGTGSGAIAIAVAKHAPSCTVMAIDASPKALEVAESNAERHHMADRITLIESDLFNAVPAEDQFDVVASNPPYVSESEWSELSKTVRDFEPRAALVAGPDGDEIIKRLIPQAAERLRADGWLLIEVSPMIEERVRASIAEDGHFRRTEAAKDLSGAIRVVKAQRIG
ncbi:MAG: peptide chain release factor N(5)-glutamine methyltransferase [Planctomycetes bacterium]|nr:peptide chain release factor N(5)-glutamine methyltransferase [Planctomycetota bacterium]MBL7042189.1 peptide chain release factor N(5)-glutamine methyltransferase [Pirellulaceae bacterium]